MPPDACGDLLVLPIYAALPPEMQAWLLGLGSLQSLARAGVWSGMAELTGLQHAAPAWHPASWAICLRSHLACVMQLSMLKPLPRPQARVFAPAPEGVRRCIVATNIAETSVTC